MLIQSKFHQPSVPAPAMTGRDPDLSGLLAQTRPCAVSFYRPGKAIYSQGEAAGPLYLVEFGAIRISRLTADGRRQISAFHFSGEVFGFEPGDEHHCCAEAVDCAGIRVLRANSAEGLGAGVLLMALRSLARVEDHLLLLGRMSAPEKLAAFLLDLHRRQGGSNIIHLSMQRNDIADYLGLSLETVSRLLRAFKDAEMVSLPSVSQVEILDLAALRSLPGREHAV